MKTIFALLLTFSAYGQVLEKTGNGDYLLKKEKFLVSEILNDYTRLEKLNLTIASEFKDEIFHSRGQKSIKAQDIEGYVSGILNLSGNTLIKLPDSPFVRVIPGRAVRYESAPVFTEISKVPDNENIVQFSLVLKHAAADDVAYNFRPFLSRYGRVLDFRDTNSIHIHDTGRTVRELAKIAQHIDTEEFIKGMKEVELINEKNKKVLRRDKGIVDILSENNLIFLVLFLLVGMILGFGIRGYLMKRVEGGW